MRRLPRRVVIPSRRDGLEVEDSTARSMEGVEGVCAAAAAAAPCCCSSVRVGKSVLKSARFAGELCAVFDGGRAYSWGSGSGRGGRRGGTGSGRWWIFAYCECCSSCFSWFGVLSDAREMLLLRRGRGASGAGSWHWDLPVCASVSGSDGEGIGGTSVAPGSTVRFAGSSSVALALQDGASDEGVSTGDERASSKTSSSVDSVLEEASLVRSPLSECLQLEAVAVGRDTDAGVYGPRDRLGDRWRGAPCPHPRDFVRPRGSG